MDNDSVCIVGWGASTAIGSSAAAVAAVRAGIAGFSEHREFRDKINDPVICAIAPDSVETNIVDCMAQLLTNAVNDATVGLPDSVGIALRGTRMLVSLPEARPGLPEDLSEAVCDAMIARGFLRPVARTVGHAGCGMALAAARSVLERTASPCIVVAGVDSYISSDTLCWLDKQRLLHAEYNAWGFVPGEAAGVLIVSTLDRAREYGLQPLAFIDHVGVDREDVHLMAQGVCLGWGLTRAIQSVLAALGPGQMIDHILCDQNGQPYRADEMGFMLTRLSMRFMNPSDFIAPADCWGDVGSATVPLLAGLALSCNAGDSAVEQRALVMAGSHSGARTAILVRTNVGQNL